MADKSKKAGVMRLDRFLAEMGVGTRSEAKSMLRKGRILVNGQIEKSGDRKIDPEEDQVVADGKPVLFAAMEYYMLHKPQGVVSATEDRIHPTVVGLIHDAKRKDLFPVGRLDIDTEGLLLITNDGELAHNLLSPKKHVDKVYLAYVSGVLGEDAPRRFAQGIQLEDKTVTLPAKLDIMGHTEPQGWTKTQVTLREGKFHQIKRMFEAVGCRVEYLKRLSMGPLELDPSLEPGQYRSLTREEIQALRQWGSKEAVSAEKQ